MIADLRRSWKRITPAHIKSMGLIPMTAQECATLGLRLGGTHVYGTGYLIPVPGRDGEYRFRFLDQTMPVGWGSKEKIALPKYLALVGQVPSLYLSEVGNVIDWPEVERNANIGLFITEGEKKSARACVAGHPTIGLSGVTSVSARKRGINLLADFADFNMDGREVWFIPDSDYFDNDDVMKAAVRLDKKLTERGAKFYTAPRGASPK
jgi:hypothetical protein